MKYSTISECRICRSTDLEEVFFLGKIAPTGYFPKKNEADIFGPVTVVRCESCGLSQLRETYDLSKLYGKDYGYRSGLNKSMVKHLKDITKKALSSSPYGAPPILDIGSNDGTLLAQYPENLCNDIIVGIDPTIIKFKEYYEPRIQTISGFFSRELMERNCNYKFGIITSIAMFYDLPDPVQFAKDIKNSLLDGGIWILEVGYLPHLFANNSFDSICQEHLEYYRLKDIKRIADIVGLKIMDVVETSTNGGSILVMLSNNSYYEETPVLTSYLKLEEDTANKSLWKALPGKIEKIRTEVVSFLKKNPDTVGYGASTKGNVLLQRLNIWLPAIVEINPDKFDRVTPGTRIPIISSKSWELREKNLYPSHWFVLPWHFRKDILAREKIPCFFPLPEPEVSQSNIIKL